MPKKGGSAMLKLRGGEALRHEKPSSELADNAMIDPRYYPFNPVLPVNVSTETAEYTLYDAKNLNSNVLEFEVDPQSSGYIDLKNSYVQLKMNIRLNGAAQGSSTPTAELAVFNPWLSLLVFNNLKTYVNNVDVSDQHDGGSLPYSNLAHALLTEKDLCSQLGGVMIDPVGSATGVPFDLVSPDGKALFEDLYDIGAINCDTTLTGGNPVLGSKWTSYSLAGYKDVTTIVKPRDGVYRQSHFLPPSTQIRILATKAQDNVLVRQGTAATNTASVVYTEATLYLRRVYPTIQTIESINHFSQSLAIPRVYPLVRCQSTYFSVPSGSTRYDRVGLLSGSKPSYLVIQHVSQTAFNGNTQVWAYTQGGFTSDSIDVAGLYCRVGGYRFPKQYDLSKGGAGELFGNGDTYEEYKRMCQPEADGEIVRRPMWNPRNRNLALWFINTRENNETMFNRSDDATSLDSVELHASFNSATTQDMIVVVTAFSYDTMMIDQFNKVTITH